MGRHVPTHIRKRILQRDNHTCQKCKATNTPLEVDHIDNTRGPGYNLDSNLQALCVECHEEKTRREIAAGRARRASRRRLPVDHHPGRIGPS